MPEEDEDTDGKFIRRIAKKRVRFRDTRSTHPREGEDEFEGDPDFEPARRIYIEDPGVPIQRSETGRKGEAAFDDIAKRGLVGIEIIDETEQQLRILEREPLAHTQQRGIHKLAVFYLKRSICGDKKKRNLLYVHTGTELVHAVIELGDDEYESGQIASSTWRKEILVHVAGLAKRIAFICKSVGTGSGTFSFKIYNFSDEDARGNVNIVYEKTAVSTPTATGFIVDVLADYPYVNVDIPRDRKLYIDIICSEDTLTGWEFEVIIDSEERVIDVPASE